MKIYIKPPQNMSRAMFRVASALAESLPRGVELVERPMDADLRVLHVIGAEDLDRAVAVGPYAIIQYCHKTARGSADFWQSIWSGAKVVWSYYDLPVKGNFYYAPLGVDAHIFKLTSAFRPTGCVTSGYVSGPGAEAIEEVADAALKLSMSVVHIGPREIVGLQRPRRERTWDAVNGITDQKLAGIYSASRWVSGLRHVEGFELPVVEGLACGARPIVFDREETRAWFDGHAVFIPERSGPALVAELVNTLSQDPVPVSAEEREHILRRFSWQTIIGGFWRELYG